MNVHIVKGSVDGKTVDCVFHFPIPTTTQNDVGEEWATVLVNGLGGADAITSVLPNITAEELAAMKAGLIFECSKTVRFSRIGLTVTEQITEIDDACIAEYVKIIQQRRAELAIAGKSFDVTFPNLF